MIMPLTPQLSEKTYALAKEHNTYVFKVEPVLNKPEIKRQIEAEYQVEVVSLKTLVAKGKQARSIRLKSRASGRVLGRRRTIKKAYVTLKEGDVIPVFTNFTDESEKQPQKKGK